MVSLYDTQSSPFLELKTPFTKWEGFKMLLLLPTVPVRIFLGIAVLLVIAAVNMAAVIGSDLDQPLPRWRRWIIDKNSSWGCWLILKLMGFYVKVSGTDNLKRAREEGAIAIFNHVSYVDAFAVVWLLRPCGVSKSGNKKIPIIGLAIRALQNIYIPDERSPQDAIKNSMSTIIRARAEDPRYPILAIAPEGTTGSGRCLLRFRTGAFVPGVPVLPVLLKYGKAHHNPAFGIIRGPWHMLRLLTQFVNTLHIEILEPYIPTAPEKQDAALYAKNVRSLMAQRLGVPCCDEDKGHMLALMKLGVDTSYDGRRVVAPPGVLRPDGKVDLAPVLKKAA